MPEQKSYGVMEFIPNKEIERQDTAKAKLMAGDEMSSQVENALASHISGVWQTNKQAKRWIEEEMLRDLRQRNGQYEPRELARIREEGGSEIFMMLTGTKCRAALAWLVDILLPETDKAWGIDPTPVPNMPDWVENEIIERIMATTPQDTPESEVEDRIGNLRDLVKQGLKEFADTASDRMEQEIDDQLTEGGWYNALAEMLDDFVTFPAAIKKGPIHKKRRRLKWGGRPGEPVPEVTNEPVMTHSRVSPFDLYPTPDASNIDDGDLIERVRYKRGALYDLIGTPGYNEENIRSVLQLHGRGGLNEWLWTDAERARLENKEYWWLRSGSTQIDGIHFWGSVQGIMLLEWGYDPKDIPDPLAEYDIDAIKIGRYVIRAVINNDPLKRRPYSKACWDPIPGAFWGNSLPYRMRDIQKVCNTAARSLVNNMSIASGPQVEVHYDRLAPTEDVLDIRPWRVWQTESSQTSGNDPAIRFYQPSMHSNELMSVYNDFAVQADDATGVPRYSYGDARVGGAGDTAAGLSMLMNSASRVIKLGVREIDKNVTKGDVTYHYDWNMLNHDDPTIKGDAQVVARGASALIVKEQAQMRRNEFLMATNNPIDMQILGIEGRADILRETVKSMDMPNLVPPREEMQRRLEEQQANQPPPVDMLKLEQQAKIEAEKLQQNQQQFEAKLISEEEFNERKLKQEAKKLESDERLRMAQVAADIQQWRDRAEVEVEKEKTRRAIDVERLHAEYKFRREEAAAVKSLPAPERQPAPQKATSNQPIQAGDTIINLHVDAGSGKVKKKIEVERGKDGLITGADVSETPAE